MSKIPSRIYLLFFCIFSSLSFNNLYSKSIYEFFDLPILSELAPELKCYIAQKYVKKYGWWYLERTLPHKKPVYIVNFNTKSNKILTITNDYNNSDSGEINIYDCSGKKLLSIYDKETISSACFNQNSDKILTGSSKAKIYFLTEDQNQLLVSKNIDFKCKSWIDTAFFNKSEDHILIKPNGDEALLIDIKKQKIIAKLHHESRVFSAKFNSQYNKIITSSYDQSVRIWDLDGNQINKFVFDEELSDASLSPDGEKISATYFGGAFNLQVKTINNTGMQIGRINHNVSIRSAIFDKTSNKILTASFDGTAKLSSINGDLLMAFKHNDYVHQAIFNKKEDKVLTSSDDKTARLWTIDGKLIMVFNHDAAVRIAAINQKDDQILTGSEDKTAKLWSLYKRATLEQILLRKLLHLYVKTKRTTKVEFENIPKLFESIANTFDLDDIELRLIWESMPEKVQESLKNFLTKFCVSENKKTL